ncbi:MAG TPA: GNAT family N-acetyltransferase [Gemmatimonadaceae bacterium]|nr:GNAT family N-acetyltransferase [Gemmatimonadaceae bacterium]
MNPPNQARVRRATPADAEALARLRYEFRAPRADAVERESAFRERCAAWCRTAVADENVWRAWVLDDDGELLGNVWLQIVQKLPNPGRESERHGYLTNFFVAEASRGQGSGSRMLAALLQDCVELGVDNIFLWPTEQSRPFYGRHGFHPGTNLMILER